MAIAESATDKPSLRAQLIRAATGTFGLKLALTGLSLIANILLARTLGTAEYGIYAYALTWVGLLRLPAMLGLDKLLPREISIYRTKQQWKPLRGLLKWSNVVVLATSLIIATLAALLARVLLAEIDSLLATLWLSLAALPLLSLTGIRQAATRGFNHIVQGQLAGSIVRPSLFIVALVATVVVLDVDPSAELAAALNIIAAACAFLVAAFLLLRILPESTNSHDPEYHGRRWIVAATPMLLTGFLQSTSGRIDILMLGSIEGTEAAGIYAIVNRGVQLVTFGLVAVNIAIGPTVASLYAAGDIGRLQRMVTKSARAVLLVTALIAILLIAASQWFLLLFGTEFVQGQEALVILSLGRIFSAFIGSVGLLLNMTGFERDVFFGLLSSVGLNVLLNLAFIPLWGIEGAAVSSTISLFTLNIILAILVYKRIGIHTTAIGKVRRPIF